MTFIAYYLHWPQQEIEQMTHEDRRRFCEEISVLHSKMSGDKQKNPFDIG